MTDFAAAGMDGVFRIRRVVDQNSNRCTLTVSGGFEIGRLCWSAYIVI